ncbi:fatty acid--CoA ligase family protein [Pseudalkalibacillus caeni]|uniref:Fatty acid--CoA ligase family protein n=1 Tax=Exobacillus caeni TaxID=2574798 RepID=A0A5R9FC06_9BACL|nr:fatty acid--CoA ligase family protein [Pseudalkalibacillus caeni]TLS38094.1 fatty acid--CoA ligase family protein [Pseudalkalibacillus caeni]
MNLTSRIEQTAMKNGKKDAYFFQGETVTYSQLSRYISRFANNLQEAGIQKGDHIALILGNCPEFLISYYGALKMGAVVIPINPIYTPDEIAYLLHNGDVKAVVTLDKALPLVEKLSEQLPNVKQVIYTGSKAEDETSGRVFLKPFAEMVDENSKEYVAAEETADDDLAVILYTSGTTGKPKGAMLTHKNLYSNASDTADYLKIDSNDRVITVLPMFHVFCMTVAMNAPLMAGGTLLIMPKFSPAEVFKVASEQKATIFAGVPTMYNFLYQFPEGNKEDFSDIRLCISGGASLPVSLLHRFEEKFDVRVSEGYGLSEAAPVTCFNPLDRPRKAGSIGKSITNVENKVVNELGEELPPNEVGELVVRGPNVMKGYYKMPEDTAVTIKDGWLYTGDLAKMDEDGYFYIVDRKKDMILVGGYNVYPREVEEVLYNHPNVVEAAVIGVPDPNFGEAVKSAVVSNDPSLTAEELTSYCRKHLAKYKCPTEIEFLKELPKNTTGKILRKALKEQITNH